MPEHRAAAADDISATLTRAPAVRSSAGEGTRPSIRVPRPPSDSMPPPESLRRRTSIQGLACLALALTLAYLVWRTVATLNGSALWLSIPLLALEVHALLSLLMFTHDLWHLDARPDHADRRAQSPADDSHAPRVALLIPTYNEPAPILLPTIAAALAARGDHETWVLDDGDRPWVRDMAEELGARYRSRRNGKHAKAGNLNDALPHVGADLVAVVDADHVVTAGFLEALVPYFADPAIAVVQTPQDFFNQSSFEHVERGDGKVFAEQAMFYRVVLAGRNRWGAAFWCGTGAMIRVEALLSVGGVATESVTEDIQTTLRMHRRGWKTVHHNEVLAHGLAADDSSAFYTQRARWGAGAMQVLKRDNPLRGRGLTLHQRVAYLATLLGWFESWRTLGYVLLPMATVLSGANPVAADWPVFAAAYLTSFAAQRVALVALSRGRAPVLETSLFEFVRLPATFAATLAIFTSGPAGFAVTPKSAADSRARGQAPVLIWCLLVGSLVAAAWYLATVAGLTPVEYQVPWVAHGAMVWLVVNGALLVAAMHRIRHERFAGNRRDAWRFATAQLDVQVDLADRSTVAAAVTDVSLSGARITLAGTGPAVTTGDLVLVHLPLAGPDHSVEILSLEAQVRSTGTDRSGDTWVGLHFTATNRQRARLALALYQTWDEPTAADCPTGSPTIPGPRAAADGAVDHTRRRARRRAHVA